MDGPAVLYELLYGLPFIMTGLLVWRMRSKNALIIVALAWMSHRFYDLYYDHFFLNSGVFNWYPAFCAIVDVTVGVYLLIYCRRVFTNKII